MTQTRLALYDDTPLKAHLPWNVKRYGATGDSETDDSAAVQAAIDAAAVTGGIVFFPPGNYKIATALAQKSSIELRGSGPGTILTGAAADQAVIQNADLVNGNTDLRISGLKIVGGGGTGSTGHAINWSKVTRGQIDRVQASNMSGYGVRLLTCSSVTLRDILAAASTNSGGIAVANSSATCSDIQMENVRSVSHVGAGGYGFYIDGVSQLRMVHCVGSANDDDNAYLAHITGGAIIGCDFLSSVSDKGAHIDANTQLYLFGCRFNGNAGAGVQLDPCSGDEGVRFVACEFDENGVDGLFINASDISVCDCVVSGNNARGIRAYYNTPTRLLISGCRIVNNGTAGTKRPGIELDYVSAALISNCIIDDTQATKTQSYGILENNTCGAGNIVKNCVARGNNTAAYSLQGGTANDGNI